MSLSGSPLYNSLTGLWSDFYSLIKNYRLFYKVHNSRSCQNFLLQEGISFMAPWDWIRSSFCGQLKDGKLVLNEIILNV